MTVAVFRSASSIPSSNPRDVPRRDTRASGGDAELNTETVWLPLSRELGESVARAHRAWAERHAPHLLQEWANV